MLGRVLRIVLALVLVGILAVLYVLSQGGDLRRQTQIVSDLRNLKDIDTAWNRDLAAAYQKVDVSAAYQVHPRLRAYVVVENLLDLTYAAAFGYPALPLTARAGAKVTFGGK